MFYVVGLSCPAGAVVPEEVLSGNQHPQRAEASSPLITGSPHTSKSGLQGSMTQDLVLEDKPKS